MPGEDHAPEAPWMLTLWAHSGHSLSEEGGHSCFQMWDLQLKSQPHL